MMRWDIVCITARQKFGRYKIINQGWVVKFHTIWFSICSLEKKKSIYFRSLLWINILKYIEGNLLTIKGRKKTKKKKTFSGSKSFHSMKNLPSLPVCFIVFRFYFVGTAVTEALVNNECISADDLLWAFCANKKKPDHLTWALVRFHSKGPFTEVCQSI